jgi:hypothetical protein
LAQLAQSNGPNGQLKVVWRVLIKKVSLDGDESGVESTQEAHTHTFSSELDTQKIKSSSHPRTCKLFKLAVTRFNLQLCLLRQVQTPLSLFRRFLFPFSARSAERDHLSE